MTNREAIALLDNPLLRGLTGRVASSSSAIRGPVHWADLGCGAGTFTLALANFLPSGSIIVAIDLNPGIAKQTTNNNVTILPRAADFTQLNFPQKDLDGIHMANALHYVKDQPALAS